MTPPNIKQPTPERRAVQSLGSCFGRLVALIVIIGVPIAAMVFALRWIRAEPPLIERLSSLPATLQHGLCIILAAILHAMITRSAKPKKGMK